MTANARLHYRFGRVDITPNRPLPLFGRVGRTAPWDEIVSRLEANFALFSEGVRHQALIAIDSLYPSQALIDAVADRLQQLDAPLAKDAMLFVASHTHNAPALDATKPLLGQMDAGYLAEVATKIADGLHRLFKSEPHHANLSHATAPCDAAIFRRRWVKGLNLDGLKPERRMMMAPQPDEAIDDALTLLLWHDSHGAPLAALWHWACHAVSEPKAQAVSADFPGMVRDHVRTKLGATDLPVLYFPGFSGDIRPDSQSPLPLHRSGKWAGIGPRFASNSAKTVANLHSQLRAAADAAFTQLRPVSDASTGMSRSGDSIAMDAIRDGASSMPPVTIDHWEIGPIRIIATSAEVSHRYRGDDGGRDRLTLATGCAQHVFGYLPTDVQIAEGGYEGGGFAPAFSVPGQFLSNVQHFFAEAHALGAVR